MIRSLRCWTVPNRPAAFELLPPGSRIDVIVQRIYNGLYLYLPAELAVAFIYLSALAPQIQRLVQDTFRSKEGLSQTVCQL